jgi:hypothetical protein
MQAGDLFRLMGPVAEDVRGAVSMAMTSASHAERLLNLANGEALAEDPEVDDQLMMAGLIRRSRVIGVPHVELRAPALAAAL